jgi:hypothetical protein
MKTTNNYQKTESRGTSRKSLIALLLKAMFTALAFSQKSSQTVRSIN